MRINGKDVRDALVRLVESAGADTEAIDAMVKAFEETRKRATLVGRLKSFGWAIQAVIEGILRESGLVVTLVDRGFDFDVRADGSLELEQRLEVGSWLLEVGSRRSCTTSRSTGSGQPTLRSSVRRRQASTT